MNRRLVTFLVSAMITWRALGGDLRNDVAREIDATLREAAEHGFSGVILVHDSKTSVINKGYGWASCGRTEPVTSAHQFDIGSITKVFTAAAILRAQMDTVLSLSTPLKEVFPGVPADKADITIMQLLTHMSGFPESLGDDETLIRREFFLRKAFATPLQAPPGEKFIYSNTGYSILAAILEVRTRQPYEAYLREKVLAPARTPAISYTTSRNSKLACGFLTGLPWGSTAEYFGRFGPSWYLVGNGALMASTGELDRWFDALLAGKILDRASTDLLIARLTRTDAKGNRIFVISGANLIFSSHYQRWIDSGIVMILFTSNDQWPKEKVIPLLRNSLARLTTK
jgi:CubicO group peptidase (beta-lactamase class C family)